MPSQGGNDAGGEAKSDAATGDGSGTQMQGQQGTQVQGQQGRNTTDAIIIEGDEPVQDGDVDEPLVGGKRRKRCTSNVWEYFTKKQVIKEDNGKTYLQVWAHCKQPGCKHSARAEGNYGTTGFWTHLRTAHSIVKGQLQLKCEKDGEKNITTVQAYRYDEEASFPIKSRVTVRKEILNMFLQEKEKLYTYFKSIPCRFSATMDMWTSNQNKSYMCVTIHWIDDNWYIQKRIVNFVHVEGRHTGSKLSETFTELMVKWYIDKKMFALTLDNAAANEVAVRDIVADLKANGSSSLVCDGLFFHVRCACHILNLVARDGLSVIAHTIENIRQLVLAVKGSPLQWEELMKRATECGLDTTKGLCLDVSTRWNSTYMMLRDALYYKAAFMRLKSSDRRRYEKITPSPNEWSMALKLFQCLKKFFISLNFSLVLYIQLQIYSIEGFVR